MVTYAFLMCDQQRGRPETWVPGSVGQRRWIGVGTQVRSKLAEMGAHSDAAIKTLTGTPGPLSDLVVADFSRILAGPLATMILGDLGANVVKVERPATGDDTRTWGPPWHGEDSTYYQGLNRNKRSIALDLGVAPDRELAFRLGVKADVLVENFRPGTMARWGLGYEDLAKENPGLIYCTISGFGSEKPGVDLPGYDFLVQAMSGLMSITGWPGGPPTKVGVALVDKICGLYAVSGILAALVERSGSGVGQHVEISLFDSGLAALLNSGSAWLQAGVSGTRMGNRHPSIVPYQTYKASDRAFVLAVGSDSLWVKTCEVLDRPDLVSESLFATNAARVANVDALEAELEQTLAGRTAEEWIERFQAAGIPTGPVNTVAEAFSFASTLGRDPETIPGPDGTPIRSTRSPIQLARTPATVRRPPPDLGAHSDEIRQWLEADRPEA